jgi:hypothetical protein
VGFAGFLDFCLSSGILNAIKHDVSVTGSLSNICVRGRNVALSKGPKGVGVVILPPEGENRFTFRDVVFSKLTN